MMSAHSTTNNNSGNDGGKKVNVFSDFCQAWGARFPGSELPDAWEEDVRANLKKHKTKVAILKDELEKEQMYVEYLQTLLKDIEKKKKQRKNSQQNNLGNGSSQNSGASASSITSNNLTKVPEHHLDKTKQEFLDSHLSDLKKNDAFVTVINVSSVESEKFVKSADAPQPTVPAVPAVASKIAKSATKTATKSDFKSLANDDSSNQLVLMTTNEKSASLPASKKSGKSKPSVLAGNSNLSESLNKSSRDSLRSVSSPITPPNELISSSTEDFISREGLAIVNTSSISSSSADSSKEALAELVDDDLEIKSVKSSLLRGKSTEDIFRGQPDGRDEDEEAAGVKSGSAAGVNKPEPPSKDTLSRSSVRSLMANWEGRPPVQPRSKLPMPTTSLTGAAPVGASPPDQSELTSPNVRGIPARKDSDSSSRGRMGSPSGKSHDSSDSEHNSWSRQPQLLQPQQPQVQERPSGEVRLDRLVRKPSGEKPPKAKPRVIKKSGSNQNQDHFYDTVALDEEIGNTADEVYDNHLLYEENQKAKTDTIGSGGSHHTHSSTDLGFDEPPLPAKRTGTLSSTDTSRRTLTTDSESNLDLEEEETYVNIQYFLKQRGRCNTGDSTSPHTTLDYSALQSDDEIDEVLEEEIEKQQQRKHPLPRLNKRKTTDELPPTPPLMEANDTNYPDPAVIAAANEASALYKAIVTSILESEAIYLEALSVMLQYMKAMKVTLSTDQPFIPKEDFEVIFHKVPELHDLHLAFHESLKKLVDRWDHGGRENVCHPFKMLASRTKIYVAFLNNYQKALEALHRCTEAYPPFADLTRSIKLRSVKGQRQGQSLSLEDLLHKPVGRIQKHCLCLQDLIKHTPVVHPDHRSLTEALATFQELVTDYNTRHTGDLFPHQERPQRHLVKNSFIVELAEGQRKLRHLFLFNDVLVCAKYKASGGGHHPPTGGVAVGRHQDKFTFQLKWAIPLEHALIVEEPASEPREPHPANLVSLRTAAAALRDQIHRIEKEEEVKGTLNNRRTSGGSGSSSNLPGSTAGGQNPTANLKATEKPRKKLAEVEAQLVLASPSLVFQVSNKQGKAYSFFLSSEYERSQWVETLQVLQSSLPSNHTTSAQAKNMSMYELQAWITSCRKFLKTNMGSFLMRSPRDEPLLVGDLHFKIHGLQGLTRPADLFVVIEVDSYGHYFRKCKSQLLVNTMDPKWEEECTIDLEGSENLRLLVYEQTPAGTSLLRGRAQLELSRSWLTEKMNEQRISMNDVVLVASMKFVTFEQTMRRVPTLGTKKSDGLFGCAIGAVTKRERRPVPFIITSTVREVERRGISEVGIYRVNGAAADVSRLKKAFEANPYEAEQLLKEVDIHSVAGTLKLYLRDLTESLVTTPIYLKMFEAFSNIPSHDAEAKKNALLGLFSQVPHNPNQACVVFLIEHIVKVSQCEQQNKMSLHNLATVFGPTMLHSGTERDKKTKSTQSQFTVGTVDVMAQAGILHFFLSRRARGESIQIVERQV